MTTRTAALLLSLCTLAGCQQDPFSFITRPDGGAGDMLVDLPVDDGTHLDGKGDGLPDACKSSGAEVCDNTDNDCNGKVDDVDPTVLASDANNCGACGNACSYPNGFGKCVQGTCELDTCGPGYHDANKDPTDGCEYACVVTNGGSEDCSPPTTDCACDNADNDCDGQIDEIFDKTTDVNNCGACGNRCLYNQAKPQCVGGVCQMGACEDGYADLNTSTKDGCEYKCPIWPTAATDDCDNVDNDCDGQVDEDFVSSPCGSGQGECSAGATACIGGTPVCQGTKGPTAEICDNKDNDCDGLTDEDFDKLNDPRYCGPNCTFCTIPHAIAKCVSGVCDIAVCEQGWVNLDNQAANGCEYSCSVTGAEICDGIDNDCNGKIDSADSNMSTPTGGLCSGLGECAGASATCQGSKGWVCNYGSTVELAACTTDADCLYVSCDTTLGVCPGELAYQESLCDDKDNNCNGLVDEAFTDKGTACAEQGKYGICQGKGTRICLASGTGTYCHITTPGKTAKDELCNGLDDDCDNLVDEETDDAAGLGVVDDMVHVNRNGYNFYIYRYEASRPDASATSGGASTARSCSKPGVLPWGNLTYTAAVAACTAAGKRLCTASEWLAACSGAPADPASCQSDSVPGCHYPYNTDQYNPSACNGHDYSSTKDAVIACGAATACKSNDGVYDMSGNLREWTSEQRSTAPSAHTVRGGGYDNVASGLQCDFTFAVMPDTFYFPNLGFRCCSNTAP